MFLPSVFTAERILEITTAMFDSETSELDGVQIKALADLVLLHKPPRQRISRLLHPFYDVLHPKWLRKFIFTDSPIHIPHLLSPTIYSNVLTCLLQITTVGSGGLNSLYPGLLVGGYHFSGHTFYAPVFTSGHTTIGVGVMDAVKNVNVPWFPAKKKESDVQRVNFRFLRDGNTHTLLLFFDTSLDDISVVVTSRLESTTVTNAFSGYFRKSQLRAAALESDDFLIKQHILPTLLGFQHGIYHKPCIMCSSLDPGECECELPLNSPSHPFDSVYFQNGMSEHVSVAAGVTNSVLCNAGRSIKRSFLGCQWKMQGEANPFVFETLKSWSISKHYNEVVFDPLQSLISTKNCAYGILNPSTELGQAAQRNAESPHRVQPAIVTANDTAVFQEHQKYCSGFVQDFGSNMWFQGELDAESCRIGTPAELKLDTENNSSDTAQNRDLHATTASPDRNERQCNTLNRLKVAISKERKVELRREKNRAAARRSNEKAKLLRQFLKKEIESNRAKIPMLREKEMLLRRENLALRRVFVDP